MDRKAATVSIGMIITIIIAVVTLSLVLAFITGFFGDIGEFEVPSLPMDPNQDTPIVLSTTNMDRGNENTLGIGFYNTEDSAVSEDDIPQFFCEGIEEEQLLVTGIGSETPVGQTSEYAVIVSTQGDVSAGSYACRVTISETSRNLILEFR